MNTLKWIEKELKPESCTTDVFIYNDMDSQSGRSLPIIYQPFDTKNKAHWTDRGALFDFLLSIRGKEKIILDFGPGDGWPSLIVAPYVSKVIGVEGSIRRTEVCTANAVRLGITNAEFIHVPNGNRLPFEADTFDGIMASTSVEQSISPRQTLNELFRVLKPGGYLRMNYESLKRYRNGKEHDIFLWPVSDSSCKLILFNRDINNELVVQYCLLFSLPVRELVERISPEKPEVSFDAITETVLEDLRSFIIDCVMCTTVHPSAKTLVSWMKKIGFDTIIPSHDGITIAGRLFETLSEEVRPTTMNEIDSYLEPIVRTVIDLQAPIETDPMITAIKPEN